MKKEDISYILTNKKRNKYLQWSIWQAKDADQKFCLFDEDALNGMKDLSVKYALELRSHKLIIMEKLCERLTDDDNVVRETLYQLLDLVIFPCFKEVTLDIFSRSYIWVVEPKLYKMYSLI